MRQALDEAMCCQLDDAAPESPFTLSPNAPPVAPPLPQRKRPGTGRPLAKAAPRWRGGLYRPTETATLSDSPMLQVAQACVAVGVREASPPPQPRAPLPDYLRIRSTRCVAHSPFDVWLMESGSTAEDAATAFAIAGLDDDDVKIAAIACHGAARIIQRRWRRCCARSGLVDLGDGFEEFPPGPVPGGWSVLVRAWCGRWVSRGATDSYPERILLRVPLIHRDTRAEDLGIEVGRALQIIRLLEPGREAVVRVPGSYGRIHDETLLSDETRVEVGGEGLGEGQQSIVLTENRGVFRHASGEGPYPYEFLGELAAESAAQGDVAQQDWHLILTGIEQGLVADACTAAGVTLGPGCRLLRVNRARLAIDMFRELATIPLPGDFLELEFTGGCSGMLRSCEVLRDWRWSTEPSSQVAGGSAMAAVRAGSRLASASERGAFPRRGPFVAKRPHGWELVEALGDGSPRMQAQQLQLQPTALMVAAQFQRPQQRDRQRRRATAPEPVQPVWPEGPVLLTPWRPRGVRAWTVRPRAAAASERPTPHDAERLSAMTVAPMGATPSGHVFGLFTPAAAAETARRSRPASAVRVDSARGHKATSSTGTRRGAVPSAMSSKLPSDSGSDMSKRYSGLPPEALRGG